MTIQINLKQLFQVSALALSLHTTALWAAAADTPAAAHQAPASKAHLLTRAEIDVLLATPEKVVLIDVRRPDEVSSIGGFPVYLSIQIKDLDKNLAYIPRDRSLILVSNHAGRAAKAADLLTERGFKVAGAAGVESYQAEGGSITKIAIPVKPLAQATPLTETK